MLKQLCCYFGRLAEYGEDAEMIICKDTPIIKSARICKGILKIGTRGLRGPCISKFTFWVY